MAGFLERSDRIQVVGCAPDSTSAPEIQELKPDVVVVDRFPGSDLLEADHRIVLHATMAPERTAVELQRAGVHAVVFKEVGMLNDLVDAILRVAADSSAPDPPVSDD